MRRLGPTSHGDLTRGCHWPGPAVTRPLAANSTRAGDGSDSAPSRRCRDSPPADHLGRDASDHDVSLPVNLNGCATRSSGQSESQPRRHGLGSLGARGPILKLGRRVRDRHGVSELRSSGRSGLPEPAAAETVTEHCDSVTPMCGLPRLTRYLNVTPRSETGGGPRRRPAAPAATHVSHESTRMTLSPSGTVAALTTVTRP